MSVVILLPSEAVISLLSIPASQRAITALLLIFAFSNTSLHFFSSHLSSFTPSAPVIGGIFSFWGIALAAALELDSSFDVPPLLLHLFDSSSKLQFSFLLQRSFIISFTFLSSDSSGV